MELSKLNKFRRITPVGVIRYSADFLIRPESVSDHMAELFGLAAMIYQDLNDLGYDKIDFNKLVVKIAYHDFFESLTGDIKRPFKYVTPEMKEECDRSTLIMARKLKLPKFLVDIIENDKDDTLEGQLLSYLDNLQVVLKLREESFDLGNNLMRSEYNRSLNSLRIKTQSDMFSQFELNPNSTIIKDYFESIYESFINF